jgi:hypothetical protein
VGELRSDAGEKHVMHTKIVRLQLGFATFCRETGVLDLGAPILWISDNLSGTACNRHQVHIPVRPGQRALPTRPFAAHVSRRPILDGMPPFISG